MVEMGLAGGPGVKNPFDNTADVGSIPELGRSPGEREGRPTPLFLPAKSHGQRSLGGGGGSTSWCGKELDVIGSLNTKTANAGYVILCLLQNQQNCTIPNKEGQKCKLRFS